MIRITLKAFAHLRDFLERENRIELGDDESIQTLMNSLCAQNNGLAARIFDPDGTLKHMVIILKNGQNIVHLDGLATKIHDGDTICLFPPVAGG